jgi:hypothetical protein
MVCVRPDTALALGWLAVMVVEVCWRAVRRTNRARRVLRTLNAKHPTSV